MNKVDPEEIGFLKIIPPFAIVNVTSTTLMAGWIADAVVKKDPSVIPESWRGLGKEELEAAREAAKRIIERLDEIRFLFFKPSDKEDSYDLWDIRRIGDKGIIVGAYYDVREVRPGIYAAKGLKCYSNKFGCKYITEVFFVDDGQLNVRTLWGPEFFDDDERLLKAIIPAEVLKAMDKGVKVLRQGDIWLVEAKKPAIKRLPKTIIRKQITLFGSHKLTGNPIVISLPAAENPKNSSIMFNKIYVNDPVLEHEEHGRLEAKGWYKVLWNKRRARVILQRTPDGELNVVAVGGVTGD